MQKTNQKESRRNGQYGTLGEFLRRILLFAIAVFDTYNELGVMTELMGITEDGPKAVENMKGDSPVNPEQAMRGMIQKRLPDAKIIFH
ncbi:MAG TPA: hypothetical protein VK625_09085 [Flavitalea sp.]|nr:hypothetical protein [Flavitalea sp.]